MLPVIINELPLPAELVSLMEAGRWICPTDPAGLNLLFPERGAFVPYGFPGMQFETAALGAGEQTTMWIGKPDPERPPGDIDPARAVLIADLGLGNDQPVALDFRESLVRPRVLVLRWSDPDPSVPWGDKNRWVEIAPSFLAFAELLRL